MVRPILDVNSLIFDTSSFAIICFLSLGCLCYFLHSVYLSAVFAIYYICDCLPFVYPLYVRTSVYAASSVCLLSVYCTHSELSVYLIPVACLFFSALYLPVWILLSICLLWVVCLYFICTTASPVCPSAICPLSFHILLALGMMYDFSCLSSVSPISICLLSAVRLKCVCFTVCWSFLLFVCLSVCRFLNCCLLYICLLCVYMQYVSALYLSILSDIYCLCRVDIILENKYRTTKKKK